MLFWPLTLFPMAYLGVWLTPEAALYCQTRSLTRVELSEVLPKAVIIDAFLAPAPYKALKATLLSPSIAPHFIQLANYITIYLYLTDWLSCARPI